jgi:hypothetical protein
VVVERPPAFARHPEQEGAAISEGELPGGPECLCFHKDWASH